MKRYLWLCVPLALALIWFGDGRRLATAIYDGFRDRLGGGALAVRAAQVKKVSIAVVVSGGGKLEPLKAVDIPAPLAGTVSRVHFKVGDRVAAGDVVATIRAGELMQRLDKSLAALRIAQLTLEKAEEKLAGAAKRLQRTRELRERDLIATDDLRAAEAVAAAASAERDLAQAQSARQEAELAQLRQLLALANLVTPVAGLVARRWVEPGAQIQSSGPVLTIATSGSAKIIVRIPGKYLSSVHRGLAAEVQLKDLPGRVLPGRVVNVDSGATTGNDAAVAEIRLADFEEAWVPGMEASVSLRLEDRRVALLVPRQALVQSAGQTFVHGIVGGNVQRRPVTTGEIQAEMIEITSGLSEGEWVIVGAAGTLEPGRRVRLLESGKEFR